MLSYCFLALIGRILFLHQSVNISLCDIPIILISLNNSLYQSRTIHLYFCYIVMYSYSTIKQWPLFDFHVLECIISRAMASGGVTSKSNGKRNRLSKELSPYLLQHASNPVDWYYHDLITIKHSCNMYWWYCNAFSTPIMESWWDTKINQKRKFVQYSIFFAKCRHFPIIPAH